MPTADGEPVHRKNAGCERQLGRKASANAPTKGHPGVQIKSGPNLGVDGDGVRIGAGTPG
jgi:hypothetical protein